MTLPALPFYRPDAHREVDYVLDLGDPGEFPYTRGIHPSGYLDARLDDAPGGGLQDRRGDQRLVQGAAAARCARVVSVAFDLPTLMGCDPDSSDAAGEVGKCGVSVAVARDMERLFEGIPLDQVSTSLIINGPAATVLVDVSGRGGAPGRQLDCADGDERDNDILKEYIAKKQGPGTRRRR